RIDRGPGFRECRSRVAGIGRDRCRKPFRSTARRSTAAARRARRRDRAVIATLDACQGRRGTNRTPVWRTGHRQIATGVLPASAPAHADAYSTALFLLGAEP